jgi:hypothetical protein
MTHSEPLERFERGKLEARAGIILSCGDDLPVAVKLRFPPPLYFALRNEKGEGGN